eukprot:1961218-Amphidinium_carterae.1
MLHVPDRVPHHIVRLRFFVGGFAELNERVREVDVYAGKRVHFRVSEDTAALCSPGPPQTPRPQNN